MFKIADFNKLVNILETNSPENLHKCVKAYTCDIDSDKVDHAYDDFTEGWWSCLRYVNKMIDLEIEIQERRNEKMYEQI